MLLRIQVNQVIQSHLKKETKKNVIAFLFNFNQTQRNKIANPRFNLKC